MAYFTRYKNSYGFMHTLAFDPVNALDDGLGDDITQEKHEQGITLEDMPDAAALQDFWSTAVEDARKDPSWNFTNDEDNAPLY